MKLSKICIGAMRFKDRTSARAIIHKAIACGFNYIDTSPCYCRQSEEENSEAWVGAALQDPTLRQQVLVSTKCSPGNGGLGLGEFRPEGGFGVRSTADLQTMMSQSLRRMNLDRVDYYHLWTTHTLEQFNAAMAPGGWYDGVMAEKDRWDHLGVTTHAENQTAIQFLESGRFETITIPLNLINTTRLPTVEHCNRKGITVFAMNPFAGGFLAQHDELKELALRYLMLLEVHPLIGFSSVEEVEYAKWIEDTMAECPHTPESILQRVNEILDTDEPRCTACGYCQPCPQGINVGAGLSYYNIAKYMSMEGAKQAFLDKQWEDGLRLDRCTACGACESRCPNQLPVVDIIRDAQALLYPDSTEA
ncbi:MAG: aldo/keto reductase [Planctomycetota bacterium]|jgi:predicted aldo/keto reductase-like oxidoreductase